MLAENDLSLKGPQWILILHPVANKGTPILSPIKRSSFSLTQIPRSFMTRVMQVIISSFYSFSPLSEETVLSRVEELNQIGLRLSLRGLILISQEGFNLTVSGTKEAMDEFKALFLKEWNYKDLLFKDSTWHKHPFKRFKVQRRTEIVTIGDEKLKVPDHQNHHLSPEEFHKALKEDDVVVVDTRNWYETEIGKFKNAIELGISEFRQFPEKIAHGDFPKDKKYLIYCTGGIRCEKAIEEMKRQGFDQVYQLEGGILKYLEHFPEQEFEGECFVFDHRVAVDQHLKPTTKYGLCPHCGQPGTTKIECLRCDQPNWVCAPCMKLEYNKTCSKNCAHQFKMHPHRKGPHQAESTV